jgi:hypothetical protein
MHNKLRRKIAEYLEKYRGDTGLHADALLEQALAALGGPVVDARPEPMQITEIPTQGDPGDEYRAEIIHEAEMTPMMATLPSHVVVKDDGSIVIE